MPRTPDDITLRPFRMAHFADLAACLDDSRALRLWTGPVFAHPLDRCIYENHLRQPGTHAFAAYKGGTHAPEFPCGHIELMDGDNRRGRLCRVLVFPTDRGRGRGHLLVHEAVRLGFSRLRYERIDLCVFDFNRAALACYRAAGFVETGRRWMTGEPGDDPWGLIDMALTRVRWELRNPDGRR